MTASPTPFFAESAAETDHSGGATILLAPDHSPDARNMVSAAVPSEEDVARAIYHGKPRNRPWDILPQEFKNQYRKQARAVLALFAPLAEKPPTLADDAASPEIAVQPQPRTGAKRASDDNRAAVDAWQARALAAEAALAAERALRKRLERRIHCQRISNRDNWMIVEQRGKSLRSAALHYIRRGRAIFDAGYEAGKAATRSQEQP